VFMLCLDELTPQGHTQAGRALWHGDGKNRWFDKSVQFIVFPDGTWGLNGEHSKLDGLPTMRLAEFVIKSLRNSKLEHESSMRELIKPSKLEFTLTSDALIDIEYGIRNFETFASQFELISFNYQSYGTNFMKEYKLGPDAYFQIAMDWTYYRIFGHFCAAYESASTKKFMNGRTEVGRSVSIPVMEWVLSMTSPSKTLEEKQNLLRRACDHHSNYMKEACNGLGVDRLFLGLRLIAEENGIEKHPIFTDSSYLKSNHWGLSTSQLPSPYLYVGFGPVVLDGFGICYNLRDKSINSFMTSMNWHPLTRVQRFSAELTKSFDLMKGLLESKIVASL